MIEIATSLGALASASSALGDPLTHDGFYLNLNAGLGYYSLSESNSSCPSGADCGVDNFSGVTAVWSLFLGGSPVKGLALAGGFFTDYAPSPKVKAGDREVSGWNATQYLMAIGALADGYPDPTQGLHFQGFLGLGGVVTSTDGYTSGDIPTGLVTYVGGGYDWWVGKEWSIGVMARLAYARLELKSESFTMIAPAILATFTYH